MHRDPGCVPFNIFGGAGTITPEMLAWATFTQNDSSNQELNDIALNLTGELFDLPAGAFAYAAGFEYRKERGEFIPDSIAQSGETADVPASATAGRGEGERSLSRAARAAAGEPAGRAAPRAVGSRALVGLRQLRSR